MLHYFKSTKHVSTTVTTEEEARNKRTTNRSTYMD
jgi:hypothetical protein